MLIKSITVNDRCYLNVDTHHATNALPAADVLNAAMAQLSDDIDTAAGNARAAFVSPGSYIDQEYLLAKQEAQAWLDNGKDANAIPSSVSDHMAMFEVGAEAAAQEIVATAEAWETALREIRQLRLGGKAAVQRADTIEAAEAAAKEAIEQLNRYRPTED
jgi:sucrose-6-phosphate hydrolase SacC (GH32 family)